MSVELKLAEKIANLEHRIAKLEEREQEKLLTVKEVATLLKVSPSVVYGSIRAGKLPAVDVMGLLRIRKSEIMGKAYEVKKYRKHEINLEHENS